MAGSNREHDGLAPDDGSDRDADPKPRESAAEDASEGEDEGAPVSRRRVLQAGWTLPVVLAWKPADGTGEAPPSDELPPSETEPSPTEPTPTEPGLFHIDWFDHFDSGHTDLIQHIDTDHYDSGTHTDLGHGDYVSHLDNAHTDRIGPHVDGAHSDWISHHDFAHWDSSTGHADLVSHIDGGHTDYTTD